MVENSEPLTRGPLPRNPAPNRPLEFPPAEPAAPPFVAPVKGGDRVSPPAPANIPAPPETPPGHIVREIVQPAERPIVTREIKLQLKDDNGLRQADVVVLERAGKVHVTVRTSDTGLTESLRTQLTELVRALDREGYQTDTWTPADTHPASFGEASPSADTATNQQSGSDAEPRQHHAFHEQRQHQRRAPRFDWLDLFEARLRKENE